MESLFELLPLKTSECVIWKLQDDTKNIYSKYTQGNENPKSICLKKEINKSCEDENQKGICPKPKKTCEDQKQDNQNKDLAKEEKEIKKSKKEKILPSKVITELCHNSYINYDYIKKSLIDFISKKEFQKMFGVKKTSEVMKGLVEDKWNKSFVVFISFIFNKVFIYLKKEVSFYPLENNKDKYITL